MTSLTELLSGTDSTIEDMTSLIKGTVEKQSGISGMALKGALATLSKIDSDIVAKGSRRLLPELAEAYDPLWQDYKAGSDINFPTYLSAHNDQAVAAIMDVADRNVEKISVPGLGKIYQGVRSKVAKVLAEEVGEIGGLVERNAS